MKKRFACLFLALMLAFGAAASAESVKVGLIAPLTGEVAVYGNAVKEAVQLYIDDFNAADHPFDINLIIYDDKGDPTEAMNAYNKLVYQDDIAVLLGPVTSSPTFGVAEASVDDGIPALTPTATHPDVTTYGDNFFRACFEDPFQGGSMAKFASSELKATTAAIIYNNADTYSIGLRDAFMKTAEEVGLTVTTTEAYGASDIDFRAQLTNIIKTNPDVLFIPYYYNVTYMICSQARELGYTGTFLGVDGTDGVLAIEGADVSVFDGMYFANHYSADSDSPVTQAFIKEYTDKYGATPNALAALGYDGAMIVCDALERVNNDGVKIDGESSYEAIIEALRATEVDGVTGHITFDENNNPIKTLSIIQIKDGAYHFYMNY
ncbi:MAG: ABC transporter substrate-binding protein [Clostridiales bacterium]|nr:ABC transporter substrate-binding protein [Clostridiales bacterium]